MKFLLTSLALTLLASLSFSQTPDKGTKAKAKGKGKAGAQQPATMVPIKQHLVSRDATLHRDFPDLCFTQDLSVWSTYIEHDGKADTLQLAKREAAGWKVVASMSQPGVVHQPAIASDGSDGVWCAWGQCDAKDVMTLRARHFAKGALSPEIVLGASTQAGSTFCDMGTAPDGRVWITWQEVRPGNSQIWARHWQQGKKEWSEPIHVSKAQPGGHWEPRLAFSNADGAWIVYDCSADREFNLQLARVKPDGSVSSEDLVKTPDYEARASIAFDGAGGLWIAAERGRQQCGLDSRGHENDLGFNAQKRLLLGRYDIAEKRFTEVPVPQDLFTLRVVAYPAAGGCVLCSRAVRLALRL